MLRMKLLARTGAARQTRAAGQDGVRKSSDRERRVMSRDRGRRVVWPPAFSSFGRGDFGASYTVRITSAVG
jgi:hypothetical protein